MSRAIPPSIDNAVAQERVYPFFAAILDFDTDPLKFWTGIGDLVIGGDTYTGAGDLMHISEIQEGADLSAKGATVTMSGIPSNLLADALAEPYQGRNCKIQFGIFNEAALEAGVLLKEDGDALLFESGNRIDLSYDSSTFVFDLFSGRMDVMNIDEGPDTSTITLTVESKFIDLQRPRIRRFTDEDQQSRFSGDLAFEFVNGLQDEVLTWG